MLNTFDVWDSLKAFGVDVWHVKFRCGLFSQWPLMVKTTKTVFWRVQGVNLTHGGWFLAKMSCIDPPESRVKWRTPKKKIFIFLAIIDTAYHWQNLLGSCKRWVSGWRQFMRTASSSSAVATEDFFLQETICSRWFQIRLKRHIMPKSTRYSF